MIALRVGTANLAHGRGADQRVDFGRTLNLLRSMDADVLALQELDRHYGERSGWADQPAELGRELSATVSFHAAIDDPEPPERAERRQYGVGLLSRFPTRELVRQQLETGPGQEPRGLLVEQASLDADTTLTIAATHLSLETPEIRARQLATACAVLAAAGGPGLLMGDFNTQPDGSPLSVVARAGLRDAWAAAGSGPGYTMPSREPRVRIDYIFVTAEIDIRSVRVVPTDASDHCALVADIVVG